MSIDIIAHADHRKLLLGGKAIEASLQIKAILGTVSGFRRTKCAFLKIVFQFQVHRLLAGSVIHAGEFRLLGFFIIDLHLIHRLGRKISGSRLRITAEKFLAVYRYLLHPFALCPDISIPVDLHAR